MDSWIAVAYPQLVDKAMWDRAQNLKRERQSLAKRNTKSVYLLQRLLRCEECGLGFSARRVNRNIVHRNGKTYRYEYTTPSRYYVCHGKYSHKLKCREHPYIKADQLEEVVWSEIFKVLRHPDTIVRGIEARNPQVDNHDHHAEIAKSERELQVIQREEDRAIRLWITEKITEDQLIRQRRFITERLEDARVKLSNLMDQRRVRQERKALAEGITTWADQVQTGLDALDQEERQQIMRLVVESATIGRNDEIRITMAIPLPEIVSDVSEQPSFWLPP